MDDIDSSSIIIFESILKFESLVIYSRIARKWKSVPIIFPDWSINWCAAGQKQYRPFGIVIIRTRLQKRTAPPLKSSEERTTKPPLHNGSKLYIENPLEFEGGLVFSGSQERRESDNKPFVQWWRLGQDSENAIVEMEDISRVDVQWTPRSYPAAAVGSTYTWWNARTRIRSNIIFKSIPSAKLSPKTIIYRNLHTQFDISSVKSDCEMKSPLG